MIRYIDADMAIEMIENDCLEQVYYSKQDAIECINCIPSADVVEVVRCKNCKHYKKDENGWCWLFGMYVDDNHLKDENYCSYAEEVGK